MTPMKIMLLAPAVALLAMPAMAQPTSPTQRANPSQMQPLPGEPDMQQPPKRSNTPRRAGPQQPGQPEVPQPPMQPEVPQPATTPENPTSPMPAPQPQPMPAPTPPQA